MKTCSLIIVGAIFMAFSHFAGSDQATDTTITITGHMAGATPFISKVTLAVSDTSVLKSVQFTITPKAGSVTRPLSATYSNDYLVSRGFENPPTGAGEIVLPVYGLYDGYTNTVRLTYRFMDGSSKQDSTTIATAAFSDPCGYKNPTVLQARTSSTALSYDYIMVKGECSNFSPAILDTDGALRWVGTTGFSSYITTFFDNAVYLAVGHELYRNELDGSFTFIGDYSSIGVLDFHHNNDHGKIGLLLEADTAAALESLVIEVDPYTGAVLKQWNMVDIITAAMVAGGDDPTQFVHPLAPFPGDWFHNNAVTYNRADDSLIISSRENFLICLDYETSAIKWILGDPTKQWYQFPSLNRFALTLAPGSLPPIGQHAASITYDQNVLVHDNGFHSLGHMPAGANRPYASPRKYKLDLNANTATEVWNFEMNQTIDSPVCSSVYEDAPLNYLIDYAAVTTQPGSAELLGLDAAGERIFYYQYTSAPCLVAYNSIPVHLENTKFPRVGPQALNLSARGSVSGGDDVLIGGFIISGTGPKTIVLRALGPSLSAYGVPDVLSDPVLSVYDSSHTLIATNDDWQTDVGAAFIVANALEPGNPSESATLLQNLAPGAYTVVVTGKGSTPGVALVEVYDVSPLSNSTLTNLSSRALVGTGDDVIISGFIVGDVESATVVVRALGPSLAAFGVSDPLSDPVLTVYDANGSAIATNDNWQSDPNNIVLQKNGLTPPNPLESALVLRLPAGNYTAVVGGTNGATGNALVEVYQLH
ncbi:MAG: DVUA0089 family protein [Candidatus Udaeobacter sp.]